MSSGKLLTKNCFFISQLFFFTTAAVLLSVLNFSGNAVEIRRPIILLIFSLLGLFNFEKRSRLCVITKIILLYIFEMLFNQLTGRFVHVGLFSVHLSLIAFIPLVISFICSKVQQSQPFSLDTNNLIKSWGLVFMVVIVHMLFLFLVLEKIYGYGIEHNFPVLANMCLYFLVFIFSWEQLEQKTFRSITAIIFIVLFIVIAAKGVQ